MANAAVNYKIYRISRAPCNNIEKLTGLFQKNSDK